MDTSTFISTAELATMKGVNRKTATRWCALGIIECYKLGDAKGDHYAIKKSVAEKFNPPTDGKRGRKARDSSSPQDGRKKKSKS